MIKVTKHKLKPFGFRYCIVIADNNKEISSYFKKQEMLELSEYDDWYASVCKGIIYENKLPYNCLYVTFNINNKWAKINSGVIAHEAFHLIDEIYNDLDIPHINSGSEHTAHHIEYIVNKLTKKIKKFKNEKRFRQK